MLYVVLFKGNVPAGIAEALGLLAATKIFMGALHCYQRQLGH